MLDDQDRQLRRAPKMAVGSSVRIRRGLHQGHTGEVLSAQACRVLVHVERDRLWYPIVSVTAA
jgi:hypothetical protein